MWNVCFEFDVDGKDYHVQHMYLIETWRVIRHVYHMHLDLHCTTIVVVVARDCFEFPLGFFSFARMLCSQAHCLQFTNHTLFLPKTVRSKLVILLSQFYDYTQYDFNCIWLDGNSTHMKSNDQNAANLIELIFHIFVQFVILKWRF